MLDDFGRSLREKAISPFMDALDARHQEQSQDLTRMFERLRREMRDELRRETDRAVAAVKEFEIRARRCLIYAGEREAVASSAQFANETMCTAPYFPNPEATLDYALSLAPTGGLALEFGFGAGTTLKVITKARGGVQVYGFDSLEGVPEDWRIGFPKGTFATDTVPDVPGAETVVGWFHEVLPAFLAEHQEPVDFVHVDCDVYSSARSALEQVGPRLRPGSVILFDEYFNYPGWQAHEHRAWQEFVAKSGIQFRYEGFTVDNEQVIVRVTGV